MRVQQLLVRREHRAARLARREGRRNESDASGHRAGHKAVTFFGREGLEGLMCVQS